MSSHIHVVFGLPRSGKSTYCDTMVKALYNRVTVSGDDIRLALTGDRFNNLAEGFVSSIKYTMIRALFKRGHYIVVDGTYSTLHSWRPLFEIDPDLTYTKIETSAEECIRRAILTQQDDLIPVIERMNNNFIQWNNGMWTYKEMLENLRSEYRSK